MTNLDSKILIYNWVEERQCAKLEEGTRQDDGSLKKEVFTRGHKGLLTTSSSPGDYVTTTKDAYAPVLREVVPDAEGERQRKLREKLYVAVSTQVQEERDLLAQQIPTLISTAHHDFTSNVGVGSTSILQVNEVQHQLDELPASYWSQHVHKVTGTTLTLNTKTPFAKNSSFSCPIEQQLD